MSLATEEARAELYRLQQRNRRKYRLLLNRQMKGDPSRRKGLDEAWRPLRRDQKRWF